MVSRKQEKRKILRAKNGAQDDKMQTALAEQDLQK